MNMLGLGRQSSARLNTCHADLQLIVTEVASYFPLTVIHGYRGEAEQTAAFRAGKSDKPWPQSKHNRTPSRAVDLAPLRYDHRKGGSYIDWDDWRAFGVLAGLMIATARKHGIRIRWGADWDSDWNIEEHRLIDGPHFELIED
jgi:peptidoglycan LD-endopeptidase CwlK